MSDSRKSAGVILTCRILGILLVLGAVGGFVFFGLKGWWLWNLAKMNHKPFSAELSMEMMAGLLGDLMGSVLMLFFGTWVFNFPSKKKAETTDGATAALAPASTATVAAKAAKRAAAKRYQYCNVLRVGADSRQLWSFGSAKGRFNLSAEQTVPAGEPLPANLVARDWKTLLQPKLNIAWLPMEQVFLRVAHLPVSDFDETLAMVELQLEKLSPLPATQVVWSIQILPQHVDNLQTVVVIIMGRDLVEKFLGDLEGQGFLADRLEMPILDQLQATPINENGAYIYPDNSTGKFNALVAWWYDGVLRHLGLVHLPATEGRDVLLKEQLAQMAWAGELEGWLNGEPRWHLVADETTAANWQPMFRPWLGRDVPTQPTLAAPQLATLNANRAARSDLKANMLPPEFATRYQQEFYDRLWMRALGAVFLAYVLWVVFYLAVGSWKGMAADNRDRETAGLSRNYTNALQLKAQMEILQNRQDLKFASLDCWKKAAELLPLGVTVQNLDFRDGKHLALSGVAGPSDGGLITEFNEGLRKAMLKDHLMFENVETPSVKLNPGGTSLTWSFGAELANAEEVK